MKEAMHYHQRRASLSTPPTFNKYTIQRTAVSLLTFSFLSHKAKKQIYHAFLALLIILIFTFLSLVIFLLSPEYVNEEGVETIKWSSEETEEKLLEVLRNAKFVKSRFFKPIESAISEKFVVILEYEGVKYKAMAKSIEDPDWVGYVGDTYSIFTQGEQDSSSISLIDQEYELFDHHHHQTILLSPANQQMNHNYYKHNKILRRHSNTRRFQGLPEIAAYHVDRLFSFYRKPPFIGRVFKNYELFESWLRLPSFRLKDIYRSLAYRFDALFLDYNIYVSLSPWVDGMINSPPSNSLKNMLTLKSNLPFNPALFLSSSSPPSFSSSLISSVPKSEIYLYNELRSVSDTLLFDFLVDEHDRKEDKNWVMTLSNPDPNYNVTYLFWDNGLSFDHGPLGHRRCLDILNLCTSEGCSKICRFAAETVDKLRQFDTYLNPNFISNDISLMINEYMNDSFAEKMKQSISKDILSPLFHLALYEHYKYDPFPVTFIADHFFVGMNYKIHRLLDHVDSCIQKYGETNVLLPPI